MSITLESASPPLNPLLLENLEETSDQLQSKAFNYNLLSKICAVAFLAIIGVVLAISYELLVLPGWASLLLLSSVLSTPLLFMGVPKYHELSAAYKEKFRTENSVIEKFKELQADPSKIDQFYEKHKFLKIDKSYPLLPLIARISAAEQSLVKIAVKMDENFKCTGSEEERDTAWLIAWWSLEKKLLPLSFDLAVWYKVLENPHLPFRGISSLGTLVRKDYTRRMIGRARNEDDYFIAKGGLTFPNISFTQVLEDKSPPALYQKLFSPVEALNESRSRSNA